ncbi:MAG: transketolase [Deltaproteobacteria bacterium]|nr:transketolase [Deltaproteobacteria bacterium]MBN2674361.1 transketolase [Deltaproteobacteria bacterium]
MSIKDIDLAAINTIRFLSADAIEKANSGHPGLPMGAAPMGYVLWNKILNHNPGNPDWQNRDRFVLSAGHGSMLLYSLLHLTGYETPSLEDIKQFRQWGSKTPGHPENTVIPGVEVTTGPLGQGFANAVGLACAERHMAALFNKPDFSIVDHYTYCLVGDGCLMEGISNEAASLAGHLGLGRLIVLYDDNKISIDGATDLSFTENVTGRFEALGWQVLEVNAGDTDLAAIEAALNTAKATTDKPTLIRVHTTIGYGAPKKQGTSGCHGSPLGADELAATRKALNWTFGPFEVPSEVRVHMEQAKADGAQKENDWNALLDAYSAKYPEDAALYKRHISDEMPPGWADTLPTYTPDDKPAATRGQSGLVLNELARHFKGLFGGSADLAPSNQTLIKSRGDFQKNSYENQNFRFGVREHAMGAICNGIALHRSGLIPYCATFLVFADYMRNAVRMSALSEAGVLYIFTHDSVAVGEDGPTHQPVEHVASLRLIPNLSVIRPADGNEVSGAYKIAVATRNRPTALILTRQNLPQLAGTSVDAVAKGGYVLRAAEGAADMILIGTGSEVHLCVAAAEKLAEEGIQAQVVSLPSWDLFEAQSSEYKESVLPKAVAKRLAVEAGSHFGWGRYVGAEGDVISNDEFGHSGPGDICMQNRGYTVENIISRAKSLLNK